MSYRAPMGDMRFVLREVLSCTDHYAALGGESLAPDVLEAVLDEAAKFANDVLAPLNASGDAQGCVLANGEVHAPDGFADAFRRYAEGGWSGIVGSPEFGGQGLPPSVGLLVEEMVTGANMAWGMYPGLSRGAAGAIETHGTDEQKRQYLTKILAGEWTGTMCLTEPHAGSDVGLLRTKAEPQADGSYAITGTKIFISAGEHDLAPNIVHLVLARTPGAPEGTRGISLFIVPKHLHGANGAPGPRNHLQCSKLEEKMGIHGNATCVMNFDNATGYLLGPENGGMRCMFTMMNMARVVVGVQGLGLMEAGYQLSLAYALERRQMRALSGAKSADASADLIIEHADVRRMLLMQKALTEGCRWLLHAAGLAEDRIRRAKSEQDREKAQRQLDFLTPICKGFSTEVAFESVNHAVQIFGGHGFVRDNGVEQLVRDARITLIYEGTTQIQALDLLGRKIAQNNGATLREIIADATARTQTLRAEPQLTAWCDSAAGVYERWGELALGILGKAMQDADELGAASVEFLMFSGYALLADGWLQQAHAALAKPGGYSDDFLSGKVATAKFYFERVLPRTQALAMSMSAGSAALMNVSNAQFDHQ